MRKPQVSTIVIGLIAGVAVAALAIAIATAISARNSASGLKHLTFNVCKESSLTARNVEAGLLVLNGAAEIMARSGTDTAELRAYWRANLPALRTALRERRADNAARQKLTDCLRVRDGIVLRTVRARRSGQTTGKTSGKTTTNSTPFSGRQNTAGIPPASSEHAPNTAPPPPRPGPTGHPGPPGASGAPSPSSSGNTGSTPAPTPQPPPPVPGLPSVPIPCVPILHPC